MRSGRRFRNTALLALLVLSSTATSAGAQHGSWLMEYLSGWYSDPPMVNAKQPTTLYLWGWFPYHCGEVTDVQVVDGSHVEFSLRPGPACSDTATVWHQGFDLGLLPAGYHTIHVRRSLYTSPTDSASVAIASFSIYVEPDSVPPPPPPQCREYGSMLIRGLSGWYSEPVRPNNQSETTLILWGWFPYSCGQVADAAVVAPDHVRLTLRPGPACSDTAATWSQAFNLGLLPLGEHQVRIEMHAVGDSCDTTTMRVTTIPLQVVDEVVSPNVPNPFVRETRFTVTNAEAGPVDVGIHDLTGRRVVTLHDGEMPRGSHEFRWDGKDAGGNDAPIGIYFTRVAFPKRVVTRRLVMIPRR
jgi:hypothetical protein